MSAPPPRLTEGSPLLAHARANAGSAALTPAQRRDAAAEMAAARAHRASRPQAAIGYPAASAAADDDAMPMQPARVHRNDLLAQEEADAAFARRLAEEEEFEHHRGGPHFPVAGFRAGSFRAVGGAGGVAPRAQVREAMMGELLSQHRFTQLSFYLQALFSVPQLAVVLYISIKYAHMWNSCDRPVNLWLLMYGVKLVASTVVSALPLISPRWNPRGEPYSRLHDTVQLFGFVVFILGNFWIFDASTCREENPVVFQVAWVLIIVQYAIMMLPCVLLMCLAPMVFCCLPLLIRLSLFLPPGVGLRVLEQQGASESLLEKLPPAKRYERGMFGDEESQQDTAAAAPARIGSREGSPATDHNSPECAICLSNYVPGELVQQLPCAGAHHFHHKCVTDWLKIHATCPCDRESLLPLLADPALMRTRIAAQEAAAAAIAARRAGRSTQDAQHSNTEQKDQHVIDVRH